MSRHGTQLNTFKNIDRSKWILNISNKHIPNTISEFLSLGSNFGLPYDHTNKHDRLHTVVDVLKNFETNCYKLPTNELQSIRGSVATSLHRFLCKTKHQNPLDRYILNQFTACKKYLYNNNDILVTKADKGQVTVIMNRQDYINNMTFLLSDKSTYKIIKNDPINKLTTKVNSLVKSWLDNNIIDDHTYRNLRCTNGNLPRCYGLPKIHKAGYPLRIIVSTLGSPIYNVASFIHAILIKSLQKPTSHIKDSWSFVKAITQRRIKDDEILISLDVTALFTNIPTELVIKAIEKRWCDISKITIFTLDQLLHVIKLILESTSFRFCGKYYEQVFGSPMGSPLSPILADIVMDDLETQCLQSLNFNITTFHRYVDDIFTIVPTSKINDILLAFNTYHPRLKFTHETEVNDSINFLDTTVQRCDGLITNWFRKPTFSGRYVNFFSNHPLKYKVNTIANLVDRAIILSDSRFHQDNIQIVKNILTNNCFPTKLIDKHIKSRLKQIKFQNNTNDQPKIFDPRGYIRFPYIKGVSESVNHKLRKVGINTLLTIPKKLDCIIKKEKDALTNDQKVEVVYKIDCKYCNASYVGQTKRHLKTRINEHAKDIMKHVGNHSVVSKHRTSLGHDFDWSTPHVLHRESNTRRREIAEMVFIKRTKDTINLQNDTENLNDIYDRIIDLT
ncbi:PREDICTED: uncharacterized protein LOC105556944 [Vollenhovia emeryi]|uniref:uncharacterized protein LOC105556944 n=1 Tax=Vollenhovia emeryi TaxID=411798 RepID=UPI0005F47FE7|nr:PREDICTED: uncharacterized protein LOC105556944 [Vollenhovia emeryi]XP_011859449.1 PREDICTED: uncharacterized protein LOC105556944 [Vollenhovia emeryi]XP_011859450.1 PREDICTED: uncharacterized protein LOC105556944 [Vollenhovia emeryi]